MVDLKRLLNDDTPDYHHSRPRLYGQDVDLAWNHYPVGGSSDGVVDFTDLLSSFGDASLEGPLDFDFGAENLNNFQEWADDHAEITGEPSSSSPSDFDTAMSNNTPGPSQESSTARERAGLNDCDVCYGMLYNADVKVAGDMALLDEKLKPTQTTTRNHRFKLKDSGDHIQLNFSDGTELGILRTNLLKGLSSLLGLPQLHFEAVADTGVIRDTIGRVTKASDALVRVNINIYGPPDQADHIGSQLSEHKLWLQKPEQPIAHVVYKNPHILEFEDLDLSSIDQTINPVESGSRPVPRTAEEHLRRTMDEVYSSTRRQNELTRRAVSGRITTSMLDHQKEALEFMTQRETGEISDEFRLWREVVVRGETKYQHEITKAQSRLRPDEKGGGILADEMGMGKSLSILSLIVDTLEKGQSWAENRRSEDRTGPLKDHTRSTLIVVSSALLINNWCNEIQEHLENSLNVIRYHGPNRPKDKTGLDILVDSDIVITTYNTLAKEWSTPGREKSSLLHSIEWFRVVLDEAHIIRRQATTFYKTCAALEADSRWCLTGTPIQNKLEDIGALFCFIKARPFHDMRQFRSSIVIPYEQSEDATAIERLVLLNDSLCLRRTRELIDLPELKVEVRELDFNEAERKQYEKTKATLLRKLKQKVGEHEQTSKFGLFQVQLQLRILCNHGTFQKHFSWVNSQRDANEAILSSGAGNAQINCNGCRWPMPVLGSNKVYREFVENCKHVLCLDCLEEAASSQGAEGTQRHCPLCNTPQAVAAKNATRSHNNTTRRGEDGELDDLDYFNSNGHSTKMDVLIRNVRTDLDQTKSIIFSCWTRTLNLVERHLRLAGISFSRIDGECPLSRRQKILDDFRQPTGDRILLMTTGTGAFGLNLTCANRVFIVELQWNPSVESQAIARAIRLGQSQHVKVIRYIMNDSVEQEMRSQQKRKLNMAKKGFDDEMEQ
ncbi:hypothetical protein PFICI_05784 [Pestalotiopsis fici W106-1]|uniref:Uncharacterized protein n=1 Tax=Pestalotiopsis fici (strain W106-1 / CGMCC3.15140) TaxID=1229662 RepID=W3XCT0_PESFW|nr:uncharacterized protein PFICI_05784 [Pestalotiopsis fici W106-1]ETS83908.1 hypothetical protein PFICI_05784 [Pestalotiopsis fici W106-1]